MFEVEQTIWKAVNDYKSAKFIKYGRKKKEVDFADALIVYKSQYMADQLKVELVGVYTFDSAAKELPGNERP